MIINLIDRYLQRIFDFIEKTFPDWENSKIKFFIIFLFIILPMFVVYQLSLISECLFSLIIYHYKIKITIDENIEEWLIENCRWRAKYMDYQEHRILFIKLKNEIRFLTKKDATHFKLVWG